MTVVSIALYISLFICLIFAIKNLINYGELNYTNPFFYFFTWSVFYFGIPAIFVQEINYYYNWSLEQDSMVFSNSLVVILLLISAFSYHIFRKITLRSDDKEKISPFIKFIWFFILFYLIWVLYLKLQSGELMFSTSYTGSTDVYKLKNISYMLITISTLYFSEKRSFIIFAPNMLIALFDILEGSRTTALIALVPMFICYAIYNKKTYFNVIIAVFAMLVAVGIFRNALNTEQYDVPSYINAMGEFRETYILLPIMISNDDFVGVGNILNLANSIAMPFLQPLRGELSSAFINSGSYAASLVGRGYGLGSNFLVDSIFYGYAFIPVNIFCMIVFLCVLRYLILKSKLVYSIIFVSYSVVFIRLIIREGFFNNVTLMLFVMLIYSFPFLILNNFFKKRSLKKVI
ncbi:O-antigen polymerase [Aeromonas veronii]|uniref:O-antigen polymerase n=1 Tax=Aeromonas veronii TaxID=654 RepID=UPI003D22D6DA